MTEEQEKLSRLMRRWQEDDAEYARCLKECEYEAGYFCYDSKTQAEESGALFFEALDAYIDARITRRREE